jgi:catechol 2,3-dioxygenase-like lactoylglutathione lyase family enzyme
VEIDSGWKNIHETGVVAFPATRRRIPMKMTYAIKFVADMDRAVAFYRDTLGLPLKFASPFWSEFVTGETTLALHPASPEKPAGTVELGFGVPDLNDFYAEKSAAGVSFAMPPTKQDFGGELARFVDSEGGRCTVSGPPPAAKGQWGK